MATKFDEVFSSCQPQQVSVLNQRFEDHPSHRRRRRRRHHHHHHHHHHHRGSDDDDQDGP
jgi:hypothetical protein